MTRIQSWIAAHNARETGKPTYQGKPCPHGHSGERYTSNRACVECSKSASQSVDREKQRMRKRAYRAKQKANAFADLLGH